MPPTPYPPCRVSLDLLFRAFDRRKARRFRFRFQFRQAFVVRVLINSISVNFNEKLIALPQQICQKGCPLKRILRNRNKVEKRKAAE